jgi:N-glycosylase/DNA lyase
MNKKSVITVNRKTILELDHPLLIHETFFSGQTFRWETIGNTPYSYVSIIQNMPLVIRQTGTQKIEAFTNHENQSEKTGNFCLKSYLTLDIDNRTLFDERFRNRYPEIMGLLEDFEGLKLLRQDPFETALTFMCAQGIGMPLIRRQIALLCERFGKPVTLAFEGMQYPLFCFPDPERLASSPAGELRLCTNNNCSRAMNIRKMAEAVASGTLDFAKLASSGLPLGELRQELCRFDGIGPKIADCIALFGLGRHDAFPVDTHVRRYLFEWFGIQRAGMSLTQRNYLLLQEEVASLLGTELAGYAGHLLFHCWRRKVRKLHSA